MAVNCRLKGYVKYGKLIPSGLSRRFLDSIISNTVIEVADQLVVHGIPVNAIYKLKAEYDSLAVSKQPPRPRHLYFYQILKRLYPEIEWNITDKVNKKNVNFRLPLINDLQPSLSALLLGQVEIERRSWLYSAYNCAAIEDESTIEALGDFLSETRALKLSNRQFSQILGWILRQKNNQQGTIFIHTCPDYSCDSTGNDLRPYYHTFKELGCDIGQIALRILGVLPNLNKLLTRLKLQPRIIVTIADYEAFSEKIRVRMGVSKEEFLRRVDLSLRRFQVEASKIVELQAYRCADLFGGEIVWLNEVDKMLKRFGIADYGKTGIDKEAFMNIAKKRKALYARWYDDVDVVAEKYQEIAKFQAAEYAVIGSQLSRRFENSLILGADSELFGPFYSMEESLPTIYFERRYY